MIKKIFNSTSLKLAFIVLFMITMTATVIRNHKSIKANEALFDAYIEQRELTHKQTLFINELLEVFREHSGSKK